jgi:hypothetical protein
MKEQTFKGEEAKEWLLRGEGERWIFNNFSRIRIFPSRYPYRTHNFPLWSIVYQSSEPLSGSIIRSCGLKNPDGCEVLIDPNGVQEIYLSRNRVYKEEVFGDMAFHEADTYLRITLPILIVNLYHDYYQKSFGRLGFAESLSVRINPESGLGKQTRDHKAVRE